MPVLLSGEAGIDATPLLGVGVFLELPVFGPTPILGRLLDP
jgi:hypothetical protein